ncbi:hypothetical protein C8J57DRAFT_1219949 [Mycena rebaudengoi]|nr:hypothetical protein C8J57DRAFT_1219949 [Mycena rebaudengoi]
MSVFIDSILSDGTTVLGNCSLGTDLQRSRTLPGRIVHSPLRELDNVYSGPHGDDFRALVIGPVEDVCETKDSFYRYKSGGQKGDLPFGYEWEFLLISIQCNITGIRPWISDDDRKIYINLNIEEGRRLSRSNLPAKYKFLHNERDAQFTLQVGDFVVLHCSPFVQHEPEDDDKVWGHVNERVKYFISSPNFTPVIIYR